MLLLLLLYVYVFFRIDDELELNIDVIDDYTGEYDHQHLHLLHHSPLSSSPTSSPSSSSSLSLFFTTIGEAINIKRFNSCLTYGESLHRLREFGCLMPELDHIDESRLSAQEFIKICHLM